MTDLELALPEKFRTIYLSTFEYIRACVQWVRESSLSRITLHYFMSGEMSVRQLVFEPIGSHLHCMQMIADATQFSIVQIPTVDSQNLVESFRRVTIALEHPTGLKRKVPDDLLRPTAMPGSVSSTQVGQMGSPLMQAAFAEAIEMEPLTPPQVDVFSSGE